MAAETAAERLARDYTEQSDDRRERAYWDQPTERTDREYVAADGTKELSEAIAAE